MPDYTITPIKELILRMDCEHASLQANEVEQWRRTNFYSIGRIAYFWLSILKLDNHIRRYDSTKPLVKRFLGKVDPAFVVESTQMRHPDAAPYSESMKAVHDIREAFGGINFLGIISAEALMEEIRLFIQGEESRDFAGSRNTLNRVATERLAALEKKATRLIVRAHKINPLVFRSILNEARVEYQKLSDFCDKAEEMFA
jgi:hypothetical protein